MTTATEELEASLERGTVSKGSHTVEIAASSIETTKAAKASVRDEASAPVWPLPAKNTVDAVTAIKAVHTGIFLSMGACIGYIFYSGLVGRSSRLMKWCLAAVTIEAAIFAGNGFRCPLTNLAEDLGSEHGEVGDIFLPDWFAHRIPIISTSILAASFVAFQLHRLFDGRRQGADSHHA